MWISLTAHLSMGKKSSCSGVWIPEVPCGRDCRMLCVLRTGASVLPGGLDRCWRHWASIEKPLIEWWHFRVSPGPHQWVVETPPLFEVTDVYIYSLEYILFPKIVENFKTHIPQPRPASPCGIPSRIKYRLKKPDWTLFKRLFYAGSKRFPLVHIENLKTIY